MFEEYVNNANIKQISTLTTEQCFSGKSKSGTDETNNWTDERSKSKQTHDRTIHAKLCANEYSSTMDLPTLKQRQSRLRIHKHNICFYVRTDKKTVADTRVEGVNV